MEFMPVRAPLFKTSDGVFVNLMELGLEDADGNVQPESPWHNRQGSIICIHAGASGGFTYDVFCFPGAVARNIEESWIRKQNPVRVSFPETVDAIARGDVVMFKTQDDVETLGTVCKTPTGDVQTFTLAVHVPGPPRARFTYHIVSLDMIILKGMI